MSNTGGEIKVIISGAVQRGGPHLLTPPATIRSGLDVAGGFAIPTSQMKPGDMITVRRPLGERKVDVFRFIPSDASSEWETFNLLDGDLVVFQWHITPNET